MSAKCVDARPGKTERNKESEAAEMGRISAMEDDAGTAMVAAV
jgi:hypothetical protein